MTCAEHGAAEALRATGTPVELLAHKPATNRPWRVPLAMSDGSFKMHLFMLHGMTAPGDPARRDMEEAHHGSHMDPPESQPGFQHHVHVAEPFS